MDSQEISWLSSCLFWGFLVLGEKGLDRIELYAYLCMQVFHLFLSLSSDTLCFTQSERLNQWKTNIMQIQP